MEKECCRQDTFEDTTLGQREPGTRRELLAPVTLAAEDSAIPVLNADDGTIEKLTWKCSAGVGGATEWRRSARSTTLQRRDDVRQRESHLSSVRSGFCAVDRVQATFSMR